MVFFLSTLGLVPVLRCKLLTGRYNGFGHYVHENVIPRQDRFQETMEIITSEFIMRLSQEMDSMMSMMYSQINGAISSAIAERVIPEIQNVVSSMPSSGNRDSESSSSTNSQEITEGTNGFKRITKKDSRSACDLPDALVLTPVKL